MVMLLMLTVLYLLKQTKKKKQTTNKEINKNRPSIHLEDPSRECQESQFHEMDQ